MLKVNPDAPQLPVRAMALADGKTLLLPSPRLRSAFLLISPADVPRGEERKAASLKHAARYGREIGLTELAAIVTGESPIELIVTGSVAVTRRGARAGKGHGYADLEYALLQEIGAGRAPVVTTVHPAQIVPEMSVDPHDLSLDFIVTPDEVIETHTPYPKPNRIDWSLIDEDDLNAMPILARLREERWEAFTTPDVLAQDLQVLFVGLNPGRKSAARGHNFAGPGNHFWRLLYDSGLTPVEYRPEQERELIRHGLGITNIVSRASRGRPTSPGTSSSPALRSSEKRCGLSAPGSSRSSEKTSTGPTRACARPPRSRGGFNLKRPLVSLSSLSLPTRLPAAPSRMPSASDSFAASTP